MFKQLVTRVLFAAAVVALPVATAGPAAADSSGPANAQEAAVCKQLLSDWLTPFGLPATSVNAVCTVKGNHS
ncbi:hypothetical protein GCM10009760_30970 [Kitasatospora kazusensis]|uniref:Secreted protein n=1 Tax=Kitasatospora kazusensis TaxID=407974 RepID=A0ABN2ZL79_9ACTN